MKFLDLIFHRETRGPVLALTFASLVCVALVSARVFFARNFTYVFLIWNLFLAWLPLILSLVVREHCRKGRRGWRVLVLTVLWVLFFPNAPYIFTDLIHLTWRFYTHFWVDMMLILCCALTGLMLGFVSLYLMQALVAHRFGHAYGWLFVAGMSGLSGIGVFLGRFVRLNSWDVIRPEKIYQHTAPWLVNPAENPMPYVFPVLFAIFLFLAYLMFHSLTRLPQVAQFQHETDPDA